MFKGKLRLNKDNIEELFYVLDDADVYKVKWVAGYEFDRFYVGFWCEKSVLLHYKISSVR
jgi:hypothetical protein